MCLLTFPKTQPVYYTKTG